MSIEVYLIYNLAADLILLRAASRILGVSSPGRLVASAILCAAYAPLAASHPLPWASAPVQLGMLALTAAIMAGRASLRLWKAATLTICASALIAGGFAELLRPGAPGPVGALAGIGIGALLLRLLYLKLPPRHRQWQVRLRLCVGDRVSRFTALIDTGNRLREPFSGLPVLIAEERLLEGMLPETGFREVGFGSIGGGGRMTCFRPSALWIEQERRVARAPDVWVALAPGRLPGLCQALAPPEFAACLG